MMRRPICAIFARTDTLKSFLIAAPRYSTTETHSKDKNVEFHQISKGEKIKRELETAKMPRTDEYDKKSHKYSPTQLKPNGEIVKDKDSKGAEKSGASGVHQLEKESRMEKGYWKDKRHPTPGEMRESDKKKDEETKHADEEARRK